MCAESAVEALGARLGQIERTRERPSRRLCGGSYDCMMFELVLRTAASGAVVVDFDKFGQKRFIVS